MKVILLEKVKNLGALGEEVTVKPGFGRNFLIPKQKALPATAANLADFKASREAFEKKALARMDDAKQRVLALRNIGSVSISARAGEGGKLYGSVGPFELAKIICDAGVPVKKQEIIMSMGHIREVGEFTIECQFDTDVVTELTVNVSASE